MAALHRALDRGVNFFDTADVYGDGRSERLLARLRKERKEPFYITTKAGRRLPKQTVEGYNKKNLNAFVDRSLKNLAVDTIDLLQIHCPPTDALLPPRGVRAVRRPGEGGEDPLLRRQRRARRGGRSRRSTTRACSRCRSSTTCSASGRRDLFLAEARAAQGRRAGAAAAVVGDAGGQDDAREQVRRGRPPQLQPRRRAVGQGRDLFGRPLRGRPGGGRGAAQAGAQGDARWRRSRCAGS